MIFLESAFSTFVICLIPKQLWNLQLSVSKKTTFLFYKSIDLVKILNTYLK